MHTYVGGILLSKSSALALNSDFQLLFPLSDYVAAPWVMNTRISVEVLMEIWDTLLSWSNIFATSNTGTLILTSVYFHVLDIFNLKWPQIRGPFNYLGGSGIFLTHTPCGKNSDENMWAVERNQRSGKDIYPWLKMNICQRKYKL